MLRTKENLQQLKSLSSALLKLDEEAEAKQKKLTEEFETRETNLNIALKKNPKDPLLQLQKDKIKKEYEESIDELYKSYKLKENDLKEALFQLVTPPEFRDEINAFRKVFYKKYNELESVVLHAANTLNQNPEANVLAEYKKLDVLLFNTINKLAQKDLYAHRSILKLNLMMHFRKILQNDLDKSEIIAETVVNILIEYYKSKNGPVIPFEAITKKVESMLGFSPKENHFEEILFAIKNACHEFAQHKEFLYSNLYNAMKREFGNQLKSEYSDQLIDQDNARRYLQARAVQYLKNHKDPHSFYLAFAQLAIEATHAKDLDQQEKTSVHFMEFKEHEKQVLNNLKNELDLIYRNFFIENQFSPEAISMIDHHEVQAYYFSEASSKAHVSDDKDEYYSLSTKDVLRALDEEDQKLSIMDSVQDAAVVSEARKPTPKIDILRDYIHQNKLPEFKKLIRVQYDESMLKTLQSGITETPENKVFVDLIKERLEKLAKLHEHSHRKAHSVFKPAQITPKTPATITDQFRKTI